MEEDKVLWSFQVSHSIGAVRRAFLSRSLWDAFCQLMIVRTSVFLLSYTQTFSKSALTKSVHKTKHWTYYMRKVAMVYFRDANSFLLCDEFYCQAYQPIDVKFVS